MDPNLSQTIIQILGSAAAFAAIKFYDARRDRRSRARVEAKADEAVKQATVAATGSQQSTDQSEQVGEALVLLAEQLGTSLENGRNLLAAMDRMAEQNDSRLGTYASILALLRTQTRRLDRLEEFAADQEQRVHVTASTRLPGDHDGDQ